MTEKLLTQAKHNGWRGQDFTRFGEFAEDLWGGHRRGAQKGRSPFSARSLFSKRSWKRVGEGACIHREDRLYYEIIMLGKVAKTADEILRTAKENFAVASHKFDFAEWCVAIPATPEAIEILVGQVPVPLPPTHSAAYLAAGAALVEERDGKDAAADWLKRVGTAAAENYRLIDELCTRATGKPYDPMIPTGAQGLDNPVEALRSALFANGLTLQS